jgi:hypothetical protein
MEEKGPELIGYETPKPRQRLSTLDRVVIIAFAGWILYILTGLIGCFLEMSASGK